MQGLAARIEKSIRCRLVLWMKGLRAVRIDQKSIDWGLIEVIARWVGTDWFDTAHTFFPMGLKSVRDGASPLISGMKGGSGRSLDRRSSIQPRVAFSGAGGSMARRGEGRKGFDPHDATLYGRVPLVGSDEKETAIMRPFTAQSCVETSSHF
jgi:hypothetical protein